MTLILTGSLVCPYTVSQDTHNNYGFNGHVTLFFFVCGREPFFTETVMEPVFGTAGICKHANPNHKLFISCLSPRFPTKKAKNLPITMSPECKFIGKILQTP